jgi:hypothetical protein
MLVARSAANSVRSSNVKFLTGGAKGASIGARDAGAAVFSRLCSQDAAQRNPAETPRDEVSPGLRPLHPGYAAATPGAGVGFSS